MKANGRITARVQDSTNNLIEMILEQFLEAGALILIQAKQLIDPNNLGISVALHSYFVILQKSPLLMTGTGLILIGGPILLYNVVQIQRRRREELQELKDALEENGDYLDQNEGEEYDYEDKFRKLHSSDGEIPDDGKELEEYKEGEEITVPSIVNDIKSDKTDFETQCIEEAENLASLRSESIQSNEEETNSPIESIEENYEAAENIDLANDSSPVAKKKGTENIPGFSVEKSNDIIEQIKQQFSAPEGDFQEADDFPEEEPQKKQPVDKTDELKASPSYLDESSLSNPVTTSSENDSKNEEDADKELSSLQEEMEQTIHEISQQLSEDEALASNVIMEPMLSSEPEVSSDAENTETTSDLPSDITAEELLKAIGEDNHAITEKLGEEPISKMVDENVIMEPMLSSEPEVLSDTENTETTSDLPSDITAEELLKAIGEDNHAITEKLGEEPIPKMIDEDEEYLKDTERLLHNLKDTSEEKTEPTTTRDKVSTVPQETPLDFDALDSQSIPKKGEPWSQTQPKIPKIKPPPRKTISTVKAKSYLSRLEMFQKRLEGRIKHLENDSTFPILKNSPSSRNFFTTLPQRPTIVKAPIRKTWYTSKEKRQSKKAYSLDVLESLLFLEGQKK